MLAPLSEGGTTERERLRMLHLNVQTSGVSGLHGIDGSPVIES